MSSSLDFNDQAVQKNISAMSALIGKADELDFRRRLDSYKVHIILQDSAKNNENFRIACLTSLNLLPRLLRNVRYSGTSSILKYLPSSHLSKINLGNDGCDPSVTLIFGREPLSVKNPLYVGSDGWSCYLSKENPSPWETVNYNALSSMYAGSLAVGEVFKDLLPEIPSKKINTLEYDLITHGTAQQPVLQPKIPEIIHVDDLLLVGCGAIGQAFCHALHMTLKISGRMTFVDNDNLKKSNEQRYFGAFEENRGKNKAAIMAEFLKIGNPALFTTAVSMKYEDYANSTSPTPAREEVVSVVDNVLTRLNVQAGMPKILWNGWTDVDTGTLRYGIGRHSIVGEYECLGCSYYPDGGSPSQMELNTALTGFTENKIRQKLQQNMICTLQDIQSVSSKSGIPIQQLQANVGKPFRNLLHGDCGVFALRQLGHDVVAPVPHVPVLCGILLATQVILERLEHTSNAVPIDSSADFYALGIPSRNCIITKQKNPKCFCNDPIYQDVYKEKWPLYAKIKATNLGETIHGTTAPDPVSKE